MSGSPLERSIPLEINGMEAEETAVGIPDQHPNNSLYTESEVSHLVAREVMKLRMGDLETKLANNEKSLETMFAKVETSLENINRSLATLSKSIWDDVEKSFVSKTDHELLKAKVDGMWGKIIMLAGFIAFLIEIGVKIWF